MDFTWFANGYRTLFTKTHKLLIASSYCVKNFRQRCLVVYTDARSPTIRLVYLPNLCTLTGTRSSIKRSLIWTKPVTMSLLSVSSSPRQQSLQKWHANTTRNAHRVCLFHTDVVIHGQHRRLEQVQHASPSRRSANHTDLSM